MDRTRRRSRRMRAALGFAALVLAAGACTEQEHWAEGVVREVQVDRERVVIDHGPIPGLMGAMTMAFDVADPALLENLGPDDEVRFRVEYAEGRYRILAIEPL